MLPDITSSKISVPTVLFLALSPGLLLTTDGKSLKIRNGRTSQTAILFHALVFFLLYSLIAKGMGIVLTKADLVVTTLLFLLLSPGLLLTIPAGTGGLFRSGQTSIYASVTHAAVFAVVFAVLRRQFPSYY
jgi:hypothetical protein